MLTWLKLLPMRFFKNAPRRCRIRNEMRADSLEHRSLLSAYVVLNNNDSGVGSLRQAILDANAHNGADEIRFNIPGAGGHSITLASTLPAVTDTLTINGASQPGYAKSPLIEINGHGLLGTGIAIEAGNCRVQGLVIGGFSGYGISLTGLGKNVIQGNWIGTDNTGLLANGNRTGGVLISPACNGNVIGVDGDGRGDTQEGNVISSNGAWSPSLRVALGGIRIEQSHQNVIAGNLIGTDKTGGGALLNSRAGIVVFQGSQGNRIGTDGNGKSDLLERNVIAGRLRAIELADFGTNRNVIAGNNIGVDVTGTKALGIGDGIWVGIGVDFTRIGTDANGRSDLAERNIISGCSGSGIWLEGTNTSIAGNLIGTDVTGTLAIPNGTAIGDTGAAI